MEPGLRRRLPVQGGGPLPAPVSASPPNGPPLARELGCNYQQNFDSDERFGVATFLGHTGRRGASKTS